LPENSEAAEHFASQILKHRKLAAAALRTPREQLGHLDGLSIPALTLTVPVNQPVTVLSVISLTRSIRGTINNSETAECLSSQVLEDARHSQIRFCSILASTITASLSRLYCNSGNLVCVPKSAATDLLCARCRRSGPPPERVPHPRFRAVLPALGHLAPRGRFGRQVAGGSGPVNVHRHARLRWISGTVALRS
jgi:hypothetical protein